MEPFNISPNLCSALQYPSGSLTDLAVAICVSVAGFSCPQSFSWLLLLWWEWWNGCCLSRSHSKAGTSA